MTTAQQLARCQAEIREIQERPDVVAGEAPAWLVHLGISDWECEADLIRAEHADENLFDTRAESRDNVGSGSRIAGRRCDPLTKAERKFSRG
jgi:hypothetical protein